MKHRHLPLLLLLSATACNRPAAVTKNTDGSEPTLPSPTPSAALTIVEKSASTSSPVPLGARRRVALIMGNSQYRTLQPLEACKNDAELMAATFRQIGIEIYEGRPLLDLTTDQMDAAITGFARTLDRSSEAFLYFTGHGAQISGVNYILPVNFDAQYEVQARRQAISLDSILETLEKTESLLRVVVLDACRDPGNLLPGEPLAKSGGQRKGLEEQRVDVPETLVCFATKHGSVALADREASFYSKVLAEEILKPGTVENVLKAVAKRVYEATEKRQLPFTYGSLLQDHYFVRPPDAANFAAATPPSVPPPPAVEPAPVQPLEEKMELVKLTETPPVAAPDPTPALTPEANLVPPSTSAVGNFTKDAPYVNELGMEFVPVPITGGPTAGKKILFCRWETRVKDYRVFSKEAGHQWQRVLANSGSMHPVAEVTWHDAVAFCEWLTSREQKSGRIPQGARYRLPTDHEWSCAVGIGQKEKATASPASKDGVVSGYPWGPKWPPPKDVANLEVELQVDEFDSTSPVGSFPPNSLGLYDLCGNVWEWCDDWFDPRTKEARVLRSGSYFDGAEIFLRSSTRYYDKPGNRIDYTGFRCVLELPGR